MPDSIKQLPLQINDTVIYYENELLVVESDKGLSLICNMHFQYCTFHVSGNVISRDYGLSVCVCVYVLYARTCARGGDNCTRGGNRESGELADIVRVYCSHAVAYDIRKAHQTP